MILQSDITPFLPRFWSCQVDQVALEDARAIKQTTPGPGSLHLGEGAGVDYRTLNRSEVITRIPWAERLHQVIPLLLQPVLGSDERARALGISGLIPVTEPHGISLNLLPPGNGYEWHVDGEDIEAISILSTLNWKTEDCGGRLLIYDGETVNAAAVAAGQILTFASSQIPHAVEPPFGDSRTTLIFAYTSNRRSQHTRSKELTSWIGQALKA